VAANLFDIVSGNSKVNHPLCDECTDVLMDMMEEELQQAEADYTDYSNYLKELVPFLFLFRPMALNDNIIFIA